MERLATVSGWVFSPASIFGQKVWKSLKLMSAPLPTQQLALPPLRCPVLSTPSGCCRGGHHHDDHQPTWIRLKGSVTRAAKKPFLLRVSLRPPLETPPPPSEREEATLPKGPELRICGRRELGRARVIVTPRMVFEQQQPSTHPVSEFWPLSLGLGGGATTTDPASAQQCSFIVRAI